MSYGAAAKYSESAPCTNVPIYCPVCTEEDSKPRTIWKYNAAIHIATEHGDLGDHVLPPQFIIDTYISKKEANTMGAEEDLIDRWRTAHQMPNSDDMHSVLQNSIPKTKRERAASTIVKEPKSKRRAPR